MSVLGTQEELHLDAGKKHEKGQSNLIVVTVTTAEIDAGFATANTGYQTQKVMSVSEIVE